VGILLSSKATTHHGGFGEKTAADAARLFNVNPSTMSRLYQRRKVPSTPKGRKGGCSSVRKRTDSR